MKANYTKIKSTGKKSWNTSPFEKGGKNGWRNGQGTIPKAKPPTLKSGKPEKGEA